MKALVKKADAGMRVGDLVLTGDEVAPAKLKKAQQVHKVDRVRFAAYLEAGITRLEEEVPDVDTF